MDFVSYQVKAVNIGFLDPAFHAVGHLCRRPDRSGAETTNGDVLSDCGLGPFGNFRRSLRPALHSRTRGKSVLVITHREGMYLPNSVAFHMPQFFIISVLV